MIETQELVVGAVTPVSYEQQAVIEAQAQPIVQIQAFQAVMGVIMAIWFAGYVLQQVIKMFKGEVVEKPPLLE